MVRRLGRRRAVLVVAFAAGLALAGCGEGAGDKSALRAGAEQITEGMSEREVFDILGTPAQTYDGAVSRREQLASLPKIRPEDREELLRRFESLPKVKRCTWREGGKVFVVNFNDGSVVSTQWQ